MPVVRGAGRPGDHRLRRLSVEQPQDSRVEDLPLGTRGGTLINSEFPVTGEYTVKVELAGNARDTHQLEVIVDGGRVALKQIGGAAGRGRGAAAPNEFAIALTAGPHAIGVTFVQHTQARDEATLRPRPRSTGTLPAIARVTILGPNSIVGSGDTPSRRRILICKPQTASEEEACANRILTALARRAYRREVTPQDVSRLMPFYRAGRTERDFDLGIQKAVERVLVSPNFLFRVEKPGPGKISDTELASRLSFLLWSSIPDTELLDLAAGR